MKQTERFIQPPNDPVLPPSQPGDFRRLGSLRGRQPVMNIEFYRDVQMRTRVNWTCPKCRHRNLGQIWFGRADHWCSNCDQWTNIKGSPVDATPMSRLHR